MVKDKGQVNKGTKEQGFTNGAKCATMVYGSERAMMERDERRSDATFCNEHCLNEVKGVKEMERNKVKEASEKVREAIIAVAEAQGLLESDSEIWTKEIEELKAAQKQLAKAYAHIYNEALWREMAKS
jgi:hypothetical protein